MQYSIATAISTILVASSLTAAVAIPQQAAAITEADLQVADGNGDGSFGRAIDSKDFGKVVVRASDGQDLNGVAVGLSTQGVTCQIFDPKSLQPLSAFKPFTFETSGKIAFGQHGSDGSTASNAADAIDIALCCDLSGKFASTCGKPQGSGKGVNNGSNGGAAGSTQKALPVEMLFRGLSELAFPETVLADGKPHAIGATPIGGIEDISITKQHTAVQCMVFSDLAGKHQVGNTFNVIKNKVQFTDFHVDTAVTVGSIACVEIKA